MSTVHSGIDVHRFQVEIPSEALDDLRRRIAATRWPSKELVGDRSQGVQLATIQELARYWKTDYDFGRVEARLNALPQFVTEIDGVEVHFIHVRSEHENALPLIMTHGWPGSVIELIDSVGPLTDPTAHAGKAEDAFHLVLPSLPGYGFSGTLATTETISWGILYYAFAAFLVPMQQELGWSTAALTGAYSLALLVSGLAAVPVGRWVDRHGPRLLMTVGSIGGTLLVLAWARIDSAPQLLSALGGDGTGHGRDPL